MNKHMTSTELLALHQYLCNNAANIMKSKNHDYTAGSGDCFANFRSSEYFGIHPVTGMQMRQLDKIKRVHTYVEKGALRVEGESVEDAILDQINYLVLQYGYLVESGAVKNPVPTDFAKWPPMWDDLATRVDAEVPNCE